MTSFTLNDLARIVAERAAAPPAESYTAKLIAGGPSKAAKKLMPSWTARLDRSSWPSSLKRL